MKYLKKFENFEAEEMELNPTAYNMDQEEEAWEEDEESRSMDNEEEEEEEEDGYESEVTLEKKKIPAGLKAYLDKKKKAAGSKSTTKGKEAKEDKGIDKKGLTAGQKKLPEAMQRAILKKQK